MITCTGCKYLTSGGGRLGIVCCLEDEMVSAIGNTPYTSQETSSLVRYSCMHHLMMQ